MARLLLVDDEPGMLFALEQLARSRGHEALLASSFDEALSLVGRADLVITDYTMPGKDGVELIAAIRELDATLPCVLMTGQGSERLAVRAIRTGAYDYVSKPFDLDELGLVIDRALETRTLRLQNRRLTAERAIGRSIVGESPAIRRLLDLISRVAPRDITVLVRGETGTGKELVAGMLHAESPRAKGPLVRFNCAAIPGELAEAELFGHARGAFTGAMTARRGFFAEASGGTLVLDEVGELPLSIQAKLLRVLQEGEIQPVGAGRVERVDVRVIASTNRDLAARVRAGEFREDLYYRLAVVEIYVPSLSERREDIPALAREFARRFAQRFALEELRLSNELVTALAQAPWPGNVRQLENTIARMVALSDGGELGPELLRQLPPASEPEPDDGGPLLPAIEPAPMDAAASATPGLSFKEQLESFERNLIRNALAAAHGNQSEAARALLMSRSALLDRLKKYSLGTSRALEPSHVFQ